MRIYGTVECTSASYRFLLGPIEDQQQGLCFQCGLLDDREYFNIVWPYVVRLSTVGDFTTRE